MGWGRGHLCLSAVLFTDTHNSLAGPGEGYCAAQTDNVVQAELWRTAKRKKAGGLTVFVKDRWCHFCERTSLLSRHCLL